MVIWYMVIFAMLCIGWSITQVLTSLTKQTTSEYIIKQGPCDIYFTVHLNLRRKHNRNSANLHFYFDTSSMNF